MDSGYALSCWFLLLLLPVFHHIIRRGMEMTMVDFFGLGARSRGTWTPIPVRRLVPARVGLALPGPPLQAAHS